MRRISPTEPTRYELMVEHTSGHRVLVCYTPRRTLSGLLAAGRERFADLERVTGVKAWDAAGKAAEGLVSQNGAWTLRFSGRTQREAHASELPFVADGSVELAVPIAAGEAPA